MWREWERYGAHVRVVASDDGRTIPTERIIAAITENTAIAVLSHAYYVSGAIADVRAIQAHCRKVGAMLCVDAYQTTGVYPYDVTAWDLDIVTGGSHKWLLRRPRLRLDLRQARAARTPQSGGDGLDGACAAVQL